MGMYGNYMEMYINFFIGYIRCLFILLIGSWCNWKTRAWEWGAYVMWFGVNSFGLKVSFGGFEDWIDTFGHGWWGNALVELILMNKKSI